MKEFCKKLPKIELHAHLNGSLSTQTLKNLGCFDESVSQYQKLTSIFEKSPQTLNECFSLFAVAHNATKTKENVYLATESVIKEFYEDGVIYLELRTTPRCEENLSKREYIETVVKAIQDSLYDIVVKLLLSIDRRHNEKTSWEAMELIIDMKNKYPDVVKGVDLCGNPNEGLFDRNLFEKARQSGLKVSLHCGEVKNDEEVKQIFEFKPDRIGHGTFIHPDFSGSKELWDMYCQLRIPTECCLTSNIICGTSKSVERHHVKQWIKNKLPFCLSTDDKGVFCTDLTTEYYLVQKCFKLTRNQLWDITCQSIELSFADEKEKKILKRKLDDWKTININ